MEHREFILFEWVVIDTCDLNCVYCINQGAFSQKPRSSMKYISGIEVEIAGKIVELSANADKVVVNLTGGEPTVADHFIEVLSVLTRSPNISIYLITNLRNMKKYAEDMAPFFHAMKIMGSLHIKLRTDREIEDIITLINNCKTRVPIYLSQVDYELSEQDRKNLSRITESTGIGIELQPYVAPWALKTPKEASESGHQESPTETVEHDKIPAISSINPASTLGKRCCLGYSHFLLLAGGLFHYNLWCSGGPCKTGYFLGLKPSNFGDYILDHMEKCPKPACGCNYNKFQYEYYRKACKRLGYSENEIF